jgi:hypothetical protein
MSKRPFIAARLRSDLRQLLQNQKIIRRGHGRPTPLKVIEIEDTLSSLVSP